MQAIRLVRTSSDNQDYRGLVVHLDAYLARQDGEEHAFYAQYNKSDSIKHVVVAYLGDEVVGCGAIKQFDEQTMEVKRMYTSPKSRGLGVAKTVLAELESWAHELGYERCVLETGKRQPEAIALYKKCGYRSISNYGQYAGMDNSLCFEKPLG